jgi:hypothetical protein
MRAVLRMSRLAIVTSFVALLVVVGALVLIADAFGASDHGHAGQQLSFGKIPSVTKGGNLDLKTVPDFVAVGGGKKVDGYVPRAYFITAPGKPVPSKVGAVAPVYARNLKTIVGHFYPGGIGFVPLGKSAPSQPCDNRYFVNGTTIVEPIPCPSTVEVVPNVVGMYTPTAMGQLSASSFDEHITYVHSPSVPGGHIVSISPVPGTKVSAQSVINVVSSIPPGLPLPPG